MTILVCIVKKIFYNDFFQGKNIQICKYVLTGIPRLQRFLVARFHFARIYEAEVLYYKIMYFFDNFFWLYYDSHSANFT